MFLVTCGHRRESDAGGAEAAVLREPAAQAPARGLLRGGETPEARRAARGGRRLRYHR